jgi:C_GCAxxG_C_C family probable redox protein
MGYQKLTILAALATVPATMIAETIDADSLRRAFPPAFQATTQHESLDSLLAEAQRQIAARQGKHYGCSAISLTAIASTLGSVFTEQQLRSMSDSFSGGIGHEFSQGTCGALTGAIIALGFYASGDKQKHLRLAREVYEELKQQEGTVACGDIYGQYHFDHCDGCNLCTVKKVVEILYREGDIQTSTIAPWQSVVQQNNNTKK